MKKGPIIIVALLIAFLLFIGGMQYGKRVETANKAIAIILSITPPPYTITIIPHKYITVTNENCGLSYLLPDYAEDTKDTITVSCGKDSASDSAKLNKEGYLQFTTDNPNNKMSVYIQVKAALLPLIKRTLTFSQ